MAANAAVSCRSAKCFICAPQTAHSRAVPLVQLGHGLQTGDFNKSRFCISSVFSGSGTSQSMQRNLRPPLFTSMNLFGLPHFEQVGGGVFLAMALALDRAGALPNSLSPITAEAGR